MFRKPRNNLTPDIGRPPSPPSSIPALRPAAQSNIPANSTPNPLRMATKTAPLTPAPNKGSPNTRGFPAKLKSTAAKNGSILNFFKKSDQNYNADADPLFLEDNSPQKSSSNRPSYSHLIASPESSISEDLYAKHDEEHVLRFNETTSSSKRRKLSMSTAKEADGPDRHSLDDRFTGENTASSHNLDNETNSPSHESASRQPATRARPTGPFLEDSDSDDDGPLPPPTTEQVKGNATDWTVEQADDMTANEVADGKIDIDANQGPPSLVNEATSYAEEDGFADFEGMEDFDDEYLEGDEFVEKRWQLEQRRLELAEQGLEGDFEGDDFGELPNGAGLYDPEEERVAEPEVVPGPEQSAAACPICEASFLGVSDQEASVHVNHCLDGNPTPLPVTKLPIKAESDVSMETVATSSKFQRTTRPPKPGQQNPFTLGQPNGSSSAFSKLMSGHAEDAAWATAAAAENASRGKPSYQRTCPFYKILPGFNICVDAFRYGAVQGCNAYFLSHFHSDHYIGLTATWSHGPIYCSRPTANLVRQQLRVNPKWLVDLEFEKKTQVPGTNDVHVTMIPANHCPGSSLFLFEKVIGKGQSPKVQRVLHCGDFRACPAHVEHPLLKPDVVGSISGKTAQQKIDVCYLDTTYLNPRYSFPSQEDVIQACADMCVSLSKPKADAQDKWELAKKDRAGTTMTNFIRTDSDLAEDPTITTTTPNRGRLLVVVGTYSIGKERICLGIARALGSKIYAPPSKQRICACLEDAELSARLVADPRAAQVHMTPLSEIRPDTLADYLAAPALAGAFDRAVAFRPSGWNYRPPGSRFVEAPAVATVLYSDSWRSAYGVRDLVPQRGSNARCATYGVPYSEHSSFRELSMFCCALRIDKVIPTVNVGSAKSRERMKQWVERWNTYKKKEGLFKVASADGKGAWYAGNGTWELRTTL